MYFRRLAISCSALALLAGCSGGGGIESGLRVEIDATPETGAFPLEVSLKANVNGQPAPDDATYEWDLGDGTTSTEANPIHIFSDIGTYEITVKVKVNGKKGAATKEIEVVEVGPGVDITIESVESVQTSANPGAPINVKITVRNRGMLPAPSFGSRVYITTVETDFDPFGMLFDYVLNMDGLAGDTTVDEIVTVPLDVTLTEDTYWIWVLADSGGTVEESNEQNNLTRSVNSLEVTNDALPIDLAVTEPVLGATTFTPGAAVTVDTTVSNGGTEDAGVFALKVFLSPDPTVDANDTLVHTATIGGLAAAASLPQSLMVTVPADVINRPWYLGVIVDSDNTVSETDETNNAADYTGGLVTTSGSTGCTEDANEPNDTPAQATALLSSSGTMAALQLCGATTDWFTIDLGTGDRLFSTINFQNLNGNLDLAVFESGSMTPLMTSATTSDSETVNTGVALTADTYLVRVTLTGMGGNDYDLVSNLENNGGPGIDLMTTGISFGADGGPYLQGTPHAASVTVYNFGMTATSAAFDVALYLSADETIDGSDTNLGIVSVGALASGASNVDSRSVTIPMSVVDGFYYLIGRVDDANSNAEDIESNNLLTRQIGVGDGCLDDAFEPNDTVATATSVDNTTYPMLQICAGNQTSGGDYYRLIVGAGGTLTTTTNFEHTDGDIDMVIRDAAGNVPAGCGDCDGTGTADSEMLSFTSTAGGTFYLRVYGYSNAINSYSLTVSGVTGAVPDFSPNSITATPGSVIAGEEVQVDGRIKNNGTQMTPAFEWQVRLSTDATIEGGDTVLATVAETGLAGNENRLITKKVTLPASLPGGNYWLGVVADPSGAVMESSEMNNVAASANPVVVTALCTDDGYEDNDSLAGAATIAIGGTVPSLAICSGDTDHFEVTPSANGMLRVRIDFSHAMGDLDLRLYQNEMTPEVASSIGQADDEEILFPVTSGTPYQIRVNGFGGASNTYTLTTTLE